MVVIYGGIVGDKVDAIKARSVTTELSRSNSASNQSFSSCNVISTYGEGIKEVLY